MIQVFDNILPSAYADSIDNDVLNNIQYYYNRRSSMGNAEYSGNLYTDTNVFDRGQFTCPILAEGHDNQSSNWYFNFLKPLIYTVQERVPNVSVERLNRIKFNLLVNRPDAPEFHYNIPHHDGVKGGTTVVYYVNDTDGDTFMFDQFHRAGYVPESLNIVERITPKKNRIAVFDSDRYHASSYPRINDARFIINFVFYPQ